MILDEVGKRILGNPNWKQVVFEHLLKSWREQEDRAPAELVAAEQALADAEAKIKRLVDRVEAGDNDPEISRAALRSVEPNDENWSRGGDSCGGS
jgi:hypothetical protein